MRPLKYTLIVSGVSALAVWSLYFFFFFDLLSIQNNDINNLKSETVVYEERYFEIKEMVGFLNESEEQIKETEKLFLLRREQDVVSFIEKIESLGSDTGVNLSMSGLSVEERNNAVFLGVNIDINGDWESVTRAVALMELIPYRVFINSFDLRYGDDRWNSTLTLSILMQE